MDVFTITLIGGLLVLAVGYILFTKVFTSQTAHTEGVLSDIEQAVANRQGEITGEIIRGEDEESPMIHMARMVPGMDEVLDNATKSGMEDKKDVIIMGMLLLLVVCLIFFTLFLKLGVLALVISPLIAFYVPRNYLKGRVKKRNDQFINMFPDVLDMIVRSVRSGFPVNTAIQMVAENMEAPISTEFQQVADEIAYGRSLNEALIRLSHRIDEPDISFFVVVLTVQQETGGNLAEIISNLAEVIRQRKQMRLKIRALTSEGRATSYILGGLPVMLFIILNFIAPQHLAPLYESAMGNIILAISGGLIVLAMWIVRRMVDIDI
jgi:tight adherence protein B